MGAHWVNALDRIVLRESIMRTNERYANNEPSSTRYLILGRQRR